MTTVAETAKRRDGFCGRYGTRQVVPFHKTDSWNNL